MNRIPAVSNKKMKRIFFTSIFLIPAFMLVNILLSFLNTVRTVEISIASESMKTAEMIASQIDVNSFEHFLQNATMKNPDYWKLRDFLSDYRSKIGAKHVYIVVFDKEQKSRVMISGQPIRSNLETEIGEACTLLYEDAQPAIHGRPFHTGVIHDPKYGDYLTAGAPILNMQGHMIGIIGIDTSTELLEEIKQRVLVQSISSFVANSLIIGLFLLAYYLVRRWYNRELQRAIGDTERTFQGEFRSILTSIRSIRHDFANHLQVLYGLLELQRYERAREYIRSLSTEVRVIDLTSQIANPVLLVLLHSKWEQAKAKDIEFTFQLTPEESFEGVLSTDLIKILSNLLDNALEAAAENPEGERFVSLSLKKVERTYQLIVENSGRTIPPEELEHMFDFGYTTKGSAEAKPRGYGLMIVSEAVKKYEGELQISSKKGTTRFSITLPWCADKQGE